MLLLLIGSIRFGCSKIVWMINEFWVKRSCEMSLTTVVVVVCWFRLGHRFFHLLLLLLLLLWLTISYNVGVWVSEARLKDLRAVRLKCHCLCALWLLFLEFRSFFGRFFRLNHNRNIWNLWICLVRICFSFCCLITS